MNPEFGKKYYQGRGNSHSNQNKTCFSCGGSYPHLTYCPAEGKECKKCYRIGHFARCCKSSEGRKQKGNRSVNKVATSDSSESNDDENYYLFTLFDIKSSDRKESSVVAPVRKMTSQTSAKPIKKFHTELKVEGKTAVRFLIDTGSSLNILNKKTFDRINRHCGSNIKLNKTSTKVITYGQNKAAASQPAKTYLFKVSKITLEQCSVNVVLSLFF